MYDQKAINALANKIIVSMKENSFVIVYGESSSGKSSAIELARLTCSDFDESHCLYGCKTLMQAMPKMLQEINDYECRHVFSICDYDLAKQLDLIRLPVIYFQATKGN